MAGPTGQSRALGVLLEADPGAKALWELFSELLDFEEVNRYVTEMITAVGVRYDFGEGHELLGRRMQDVGLKRGRLYELMHGGRGLLLDHVVDTSRELDVPAVLRPDGHVARFRSAGSERPAAKVVRRCRQLSAQLWPVIFLQL